MSSASVADVLASGEPLLLPGVYDALGAMLAEEIGRASCRERVCNDV